ncbi:Uncharacterised protein [Vibrio cholerae]|nr:Uncharacterised protein [Vibrio cholerae]
MNGGASVFTHQPIYAFTCNSCALLQHFNSRLHTVLYCTIKRQQRDRACPFIT